MTSRVKELEETILYHRDLYYNGHPEVEDDVYDAWEDELRRLSPDSPVLRQIGTTPSEKTKWEKTPHIIPMTSLNKANSIEDVKRWIEGSSKGIPEKQAMLSWTEKLDGISIALQYENNKLVSAITRGDGSVGENILPNVVMMRGVLTELTPPKGSPPFNGSLRGEIVLTHDFHQTFFKDYSNPRNAASGIARLEDRAKAQRCQYLTVMTFDAMFQGYVFEDERSKYLFMDSLGLKTPRHGFSMNLDEVEHVYNEYIREERSLLNYDIDGLVIRYENQKAFEVAGERNDRPYGAIALKFSNETAVSTLREIQWQVGNTGRVTPVAIFDPVTLVGASITRASVYNASYIRDLDLCPGDVILVERANDVIPRVVKVVEKVNYDAHQIPSSCPECGHLLRTEGEYLTCYNNQCSAIVAGNIKAWVESLQLLEWGEFIIDELVRVGMVKKVSDLYELQTSQISELKNSGGAVVGTKTAETLLNILHAKKKLTLDQFVGGLNIPLNRNRSIQQVMKGGYDTLEALQNASLAQIQRVPSFGERKATELFNGLQEYQEEIQQLLKHLEIVKEEGPLVGKSFCITGTLSKPRKLLEKEIKDSGGEIKSGVTKDLDFLICNDKGSTSSKTKKAIQLGIPIITEEEFEKLYVEK